MKISEHQTDCQIPCIKNISDGPQESSSRSLKLIIRSYLGPRKARFLERNINTLLNWYARLSKRDIKPAATTFHDSATHLKSGDFVRVRTLKEIEMTLDHWRRLKGCGFAPEMAKYCGTTQQVLKPVERFVDERDLRIVRTKGVVILDGLTCQGMGSFGRCDRNCFFFWRVEWLEKIPSP